MKIIISFIIVLFSFSASAQYDSTKILQTQNSYGYQWKNGKFSGSLIIPKDTVKMSVKDSNAIASKGTGLYKWNGYQWLSITGTGGGATPTDTSFLRRDINTNTSQSIANAAAIQQRYDSLRRLPGSVQVQGLKSGVWYNAFIDSVGVGGGGGGTTYTGTAPVVVTGSIISVTNASDTTSGVVNTIAQNIAGNKTFTGSILKTKNINSGSSNNSTSGVGNIITGSTNDIPGNNNIISGNNNYITGNSSLVLGTSASSSGQFNANIGVQNGTSGTANLAVGQGVFTRSDGEVSVGNYGTDYTATNTTADRLFSIGYGTGGSDRKDLIRFNKNGEIIFHSGAKLYVASLATGTTAPLTTGTTRMAIVDQFGMFSSLPLPTGGGTAITLTTTGTSGASTLVGSALNIPNYTGSNLNLASNYIKALNDSTLYFDSSLVVANVAGLTDSTFRVTKGNGATLDILIKGRINTSGGGGIAGSGVTMRVPFFNSASSLTSDTTLRYDLSKYKFNIDTIDIWRGIQRQASNLGVGFSTLNALGVGINNTAIGTQSMQNSNSGSNNIAMGVQTMAQSSGSNNIAMGVQTMNNSTGSNNIAIGQGIMATTSGSYNTGIGWNALGGNTTGGFNTAIGLALNANISGSNNTGAGYGSLGSNSSGNNNLGLGQFAGANSTTQSNQIFLNTLSRTNYLGDQTGSPIYIVQNATVALQKTTINGKANVSITTDYADNAAALSGGLVVGDIYRTGDFLKIVH